MRFWLVSILIIALALPALAIDVVLDGETVLLDQPPIMEGSRVLVPLRGIFEKMGATVHYDATTRTIRAEREGGGAVELTLDSTRAMVNGKAVQLDVPARSLYGRTVVPLRFVSEAMGATVAWQANAQRVSIITAAPTPTPPPPPPPPSPTPPPPPPPPSPTPSPTPTQPPLIRSLTHNGAALAPGQPLEVRLQGTPGGHATLDLIGVGKAVPLTETAPGEYVATIAIPDDSTLREAPLIVRLEVGGLATQMQARDLVNVQRRLALSLSYPAAGQRVGVRFPVVGTTSPHAQVEVQVSVQRALPGAMSATTDGGTFTAVADASGHFAVTVNLAAGEASDTLHLVITASADGRSSSPLRLDVSF